MLQLLSNATQVGWNVAKTPDSLLLLFRDVQAVQQCKDDPTIVAACMLQSFYVANCCGVFHFSDKSSAPFQIIGAPG